MEEPGLPRIELGGESRTTELRGWRAKLLLYVMAAVIVSVIVCIPAACAFFAYAEGGTSLWGAVGYSTAIYGGFGLYLCWDLVRLRRKRFNSRSSERGVGEVGA